MLRAGETKHEIRNSVVYVECNTPMKNQSCCSNLLPLDKFGKFEGKCGRCGWQGQVSCWWLSQSQREFQAARSAIRDKVMSGQPITLDEFNLIAKEHK